MPTIRPLIATVLAAGLAAPAVSAQVLFSTGTAVDANGASRNDFDFFPERIFNSFTLAEESDVTTIRFAGNYNGQPFPSRDIFDIEFFFAEAGETPDFANTNADLFIREEISTSGFGSPGGGFADFEIDLGTDPLRLAAGTHWLTIVGGQDVVGSSVNEIFFWASRTGDQGTGRVAVNANNGIGLPAVPDRAQLFTLEGQVVPEPASLALVGLGTLALIRRRR